MLVIIFLNKHFLSNQLALTIESIKSNSTLFGEIVVVAVAFRVPTCMVKWFYHNMSYLVFFVDTNFVDSRFRAKSCMIT